MLATFLLRYPALAVAAALATGQAAAAWADLPPAAAGGALMATLALLAAAQRQRRGRFLAALAVFFAAGLVRTAAPRGAAPPAQPEAAWRLRVAAPVGRWTGAEAGEAGWTTELVGLATQGPGGWRPPSAPVRVRARLAALAGQDPPTRGDVVLARVALVPQPALGMTGPLTLGERQRRRRFSHRGVVLRQWAPLARGAGLAADLDRWRQRGTASFWAHLPAPQAGLAQALALGDPGGLQDARRDAWAVAGIAHLLCVSGLHVGMVAMLAYGLMWVLAACLPGAGERFVIQRLAACASLPAVVLFAAVCGAPVAATRAALMAGLAAWAVAAGRQRAAANTLGVAACLILLQTPAALWSVSFWLSFGAVGALLACGAPRRATADGTPPRTGRARRLWDGVRRALGASLVASLAATLATAPVTALVFHQVAWMGVVTNLVALPLGALVATPLALAQAAAASWAPSWAAAIAVPLSWALAGLDHIADVAASLPGARLDVPAPRLGEVLAWGAMSLGLCGLWRGAPGWRRASAGALAAALLALGLLSGGRAWGRWRGDGLMHVHHLAVGQGDATLIVAPGGATMLVDGGGALFPGALDPGRAVVAPYLKNLAIRSLDFMVLTHPHPDHIGGLQAVAEGWPVGQLVHGGSGESLPSVRRLVAAVRARGGAVSRVAERPPRELWQGVWLDWLHPRPEGGSHFSAWSLNDNSVVVRLTLGGRCALLAGDIEAAAEARLAPRLGPCDLLKVAHHGSRTSSQAGFLAAVRPERAAISCGARNTFGHPHAEALARLAAAGAAVRRTDECGSWSARTDGVRWWGWETPPPAVPAAAAVPTALPTRAAAARPPGGR